MASLTNKPRRAKKAGKQIQAAPLPVKRSATLTLAVYPLLLLTAIAFCSFRAINDPDTWFHMAFGRYVAQHGVLPPSDIFSHTAQGREWISSGWLSSVLLNWLYDRFGPGGAEFMVFAVVGSATLVVYYTAVLRYESLGAMALPLLASTLAAQMRFNPRPDVWSQLFAALVVLLLGFGVIRRGANATPARLPWLLPFVFMAWANFHAGFMAGLAAVAIYMIWIFLQTRKARQPVPWMILLPCALCFVAWMANPYGWRLLELAGKIKSIPGFDKLVFEWMPMIYLPGYNLEWPAYAGGALLLCLCGMVIWKRATPIAGWRYALMILFTAFALIQRRQAGLAAIVLPAALAPHMAGMEAWMGRRQRELIAALALAGSAGICAMQYTGVLAMGEGWPVAGLNCRMLPCFAADFLRDNRPPPNIFNSYGIGGYLLNALGPGTKVFIDGRLDVYDHSTWLDLLAAEEDRLSIDEVTRKYGVNTFVIDIRESIGDPMHLANRLTARTDWKLVFFDDDVAIFTHETPETADYTQRLQFRHVSPFAAQKLAGSLSNPAGRDAALAEIKRALRLSQGSANACALAAFAALNIKDMPTARVMLDAAFARDPASQLAKAVQQSMR
ncbi:MAG: hypothetical protein WCK47_05955 [bacterium]